MTNYTYKTGNLILDQGLIDPNDITKKIILSFDNIAPSQTLTYQLPNNNTDLVGTNTSQTLTNKTIQGPTNVVSADFLKTK